MSLEIVPASPTFYIGADNGNGYFAGSLGLSVTNPAATLDIAGNIKIADGTQGVGKVLVSDVNGVARLANRCRRHFREGLAGNLTYWTSPGSIGSNNNLYWECEFKAWLTTHLPTQPWAGSASRWACFIQHAGSNN